jgi:Glycosyltransferase family 10 (fucosyltransferase) C-term/N-terminal domain of galactosyltransferase/N-terminal region of glycosyl transferase group 7
MRLPTTHSRAHAHTHTSGTYNDTYTHTRIHASTDIVSDSDDDTESGDSKYVKKRSTTSYFCCSFTRVRVLCLVLTVVSVISVLYMTSFISKNQFLNSYKTSLLSSMTSKPKPKPKPKQSETDNHVIQNLPSSHAQRHLPETMHSPAQHVGSIPTSTDFASISGMKLPSDSSASVSTPDPDSESHGLLTLPHFSGSHSIMLSTQQQQQHTNTSQNSSISVSSPFQSELESSTLLKLPLSVIPLSRIQVATVLPALDRDQKQLLENTVWSMHWYEPATDIHVCIDRRQLPSNSDHLQLKMLQSVESLSGVTLHKLNLQGSNQTAPIYAESMKQACIETVLEKPNEVVAAAGSVSETETAFETVLYVESGIETRHPLTPAWNYARTHGILLAQDSAQIPLSHAYQHSVICGGSNGETPETETETETGPETEPRPGVLIHASTRFQGWTHSARSLLQLWKQHIVDAPSETSVFNQVICTALSDSKQTTGTLNLNISTDARFTIAPFSRVYSLGEAHATLDMLYGFAQSGVDDHYRFRYEKPESITSISAAKPRKKERMNQIRSHRAEMNRELKEGRWTNDEWPYRRGNLPWERQVYPSVSPDYWKPAPGDAFKVYFQSPSPSSGSRRMHSLMSNFHNGQCASWCQVTTKRSEASVIAFDTSVIDMPGAQRRSHKDQLFVHWDSPLSSIYDTSAINKARQVADFNMTFEVHSDVPLTYVYPEALYRFFPPLSYTSWANIDVAYRPKQFISWVPMSCDDDASDKAREQIQKLAKFVSIAVYSIDISTSTSTSTSTSASASASASNGLTDLSCIASLDSSDNLVHMPTPSADSALLQHLPSNGKLGDYDVSPLFRAFPNLPLRWLAMRQHMFTVIVEKHTDHPERVSQHVFDALTAGIIPVYFGALGNEFNDMIPHKSIIRASDFRTTGDLILHLHAVTTNEALYQSYQQWRYDRHSKVYRSHIPSATGWSTHWSNAVCRICMILHRRQHPYPDLLLDNPEQALSKEYNREHGRGPKHTIENVRESLMLPHHRMAMFHPFRGESREPALRYVTRAMRSYLTQRGIEYSAFAMHQTDDGSPFNRAKLFNIGYIVATDEQLNPTGREFDYFCFVDVDFIPYDHGDLYAFPDYALRHVSRFFTCRKQYGPKYLGGIVCASREQFLQLYGWPNNFWGWGQEDRNLRERIEKAHMNFSWAQSTTEGLNRCYFSDEGETHPYRASKALWESKNRKLNTRFRSMGPWPPVEGFHSTGFDVDSITFEPSGGFYRVKVDVLYGTKSEDYETHSIAATQRVTDKFKDAQKLVAIVPKDDDGDGSDGDQKAKKKKVANKAKRKSVSTTVVSNENKQQFTKEQKRDQMMQKAKRNLEALRKAKSKPSSAKRKTQSGAAGAGAGAGAGAAANQQRGKAAQAWQSQEASAKHRKRAQATRSHNTHTKNKKQK